MTPQRDFLMYVMETYGNHLVWSSFHVIFAEFTKASDRNICIHGNLCRGAGDMERFSMLLVCFRMFQICLVYLVVFHFLPRIV